MTSSCWFEPQMCGNIRPLLYLIATCLSCLQFQAAFCDPCRKTTRRLETKIWRQKKVLSKAETFFGTSSCLSYFVSFHPKLFLADKDKKKIPRNGDSSKKESEERFIKKILQSFRKPTNSRPTITDAQWSVQKKMLKNKEIQHFFI